MARWLAILLTWTLVTQTTLPGQGPKQTIQQQVLDIPLGTIVEVRLLSKEKFRGRMGDVSSDSFVMKAAKGGTVVDRSIAFRDVRSVKTVEKGMSTAMKATLGILAGAGVLFLILAARALGES